MTRELQRKLHAVFVKTVKASCMFDDLREVISEAAAMLDHDDPAHAEILKSLYMDSDLLKMTERQIYLIELSLCAVNNELAKITGFHPLLGTVKKGEI